MTIAKKSHETLTQQVFISYSNENEKDRRAADMIYNTLKAREIPCWVAHRDIAAGQNWPDEISKAISNSRVMIVVLSQHTKKSSYVGMEVMQGVDENLTIIPFCIEKVSLSGGLKLLLSNCQKINAYLHPQDKDLDQLVKILETYLGIEPGKTFKKEEKHLGRNIESPAMQRVDYAKKTLRLKRVLIAASMIIGVIVVFFYINPWSNNQPDDLDTEQKEVSIKDQSKILISKGWDVKEIGNESWEAFYKDYDFTMVYIPQGKFMMGADYVSDDEKPPHEVDLDGYWLGKYEVTFAQYDRYCAETGKRKPSDEGWGREKRPVINVSWDDAAAYCGWLNQKTGLTFKLPTEAQWEKAARGPGGFVYPWGNDFEKNKCNSSESGLGQTSPVGSYPSGKSPYGIMDMVGNVSEWCSDWYNKDYYKISPAKNPQGGAADGLGRAMRGGSWYYQSVLMRCAVRFYGNPRDYWHGGGFRVACVP